VPIMTDAEFRVKPEPAWVVEGIFSEGANVMIFGEQGSYKSFIALSLAYAVANYAVDSWLGFPVKNHIPVMYVAAEAPEVMVERRNFLGDPDIEDFYWSSDPVDLSKPLEPEFRSYIEQGIGLVVFDTFQLCGGTNEKYKQTLDNYAWLRNQGTAVLLVHHPMKHEALPFGPSPLLNTQDTRIKVQKSSKGSVVSCDKSRRGKDFEDFLVNVVDGRVVRSTDKPPLIVRETHGVSKW
jgi:RecA-family ATPase